MRAIHDFLHGANYIKISALSLFNILAVAKAGNLILLPSFLVLPLLSLLLHVVEDQSSSNILASPGFVEVLDCTVKCEENYGSRYERERDNCSSGVMNSATCRRRAWFRPMRRSLRRAYRPLRTCRSSTPASGTSSFSFQGSSPFVVPTMHGMS